MKMNKKTNKNKNSSQLRLTFLFAFIIFFIMLLTMPVAFLWTLLMWHLDLTGGYQPRGTPFLLFAVTSLIIGTLLAAVFSRRPLAPLREIMDAADRIAGGDYSVRINLKGLSEFQQLSDHFNHMAEEIGSVEMLRNDFISSFSHEFKTPIASVRGFARMLQRQDLTPEERREYLDIIISESERLSELSENVLYLTRIEKQSIVTDKQCFNVSEQIRRVMVMMDSRWNEKHISFCLDPGEIFLYGNEEMLRHVWINLIDNAVKFSPEGGKVTVSVQSGGKNTIISVADEGPGMSPDTAARIFDKFYQADTSHALGGNGLGLTISRRITELHGGSLTVNSRKGQGSTFFVSFPSECCSRPAADPEDAGEEAAEASAAK